MVNVRNNKPGKLKLRYGVVLAPGENAVEDSQWAQCKDDPITRHYLSHRHVEVLASAPDPRAREPAPTPAPRSPVMVEVAAEPAVVVQATPEPLPVPEQSEPEPPEEPEDEGEEEEEEEEPTDPRGHAINGDDAQRMKARDVIALLDGVGEVAALKQMLTTEKRPTVRAAIERRLEELRE